MVVFGNRVRGRVKFLNGRLLLLERLDSVSDVVDEGDRFDVRGRLMLQKIRMNEQIETKRSRLIIKACVG